jgi:uncharacterized protein (TIGR03067 family)
MKPRTLLVAAFALSVSVVSRGGDAKKDTDKVQGKWSNASQTGDKTVQLTFEGDKFTFVIGDKTAKGTFKLDSSKSPKQIDMKVADSDMKEYVGKTALGIFAFDGVNLKWCSNEPGLEARPKAIPDKEGGKAREYLYVIFKKVK